MDIKDFILIGGGILIAAVVMHGFWIAWKARRDPLRIDLATDLPEVEDEDDLRRLRAELPNGGARVVRAGEVPRQGDLELDRGGSYRPPEEAADQPEPATGRSASPSRKTEPRLGPAPQQPAPKAPAALKAPAASVPAPRTAESASQRPAGSRTVVAERPTARPRGEPPASPRDKVSDVTLPERAARVDEPKEPRRWPARKASVESRPAERPVSRAQRGRGVPAGGVSTGGASAGGDSRKSEQPVQELIVVNVLAPKGKPFVGGGLIEALRARGLRYGDMNIFHRLDPKTRQSLYSVANVVEPGTFDIADLDGFRSPGVCFFMQLPGPEHPMETFEDMLKVARDVAMRVGGSLLDEQRSVMTGQTVEHYRQRISDFCRRRMSMRA